MVLAKVSELLHSLFSNKLIIGLISLVQFFFCVSFFRNMQTGSAFINLFLYWIVLFLYSIYSRQKGVILMAFLVSFFVFLLGRDVFVSFLKFDATDIYLFPTNCVAHMYYCMHLSLFGIFLGFSLLSNQKQKENVPSILGVEKWTYLKRIVLRIFYFTLIFKAADIAANIYNFIVLGTRDHHSIYLLQKLAQINYLFFIGFLMLYPSKKELMPVLKIVIILQFFSFFTGTRGDFIYFAVLIFSYLLYRDYSSKRKKQTQEIFLTKRVWKALLVIMPFFLIFMGLYASIRLGEGAETTGFSNDLAAFFVQQGGSSGVIGYAKYYEDSFPTSNISYTFGPLINFIKYGFVGKLLGYQMPGLEDAPFYANNMGATITWLVSPNYYYAGGGLGNQYIAELYIDFGYFGVFVFSILLGFVIRMFVFFSTKSWILNTLMAFGVQAIISMPRDFYLNWLIGLLSMLNIIILLFVSQYASKKASKVLLLRTQI